MKRKSTRNMSDIDRFLSYVIPEPNSGCWLWMGAARNRGYGNFHSPAHGGEVVASRWILEFYKGAIPAGNFACHKCDNPPCVNPDHLFVGSRSENMLDASRKGRISNQNAKKTHCRLGHLLATPEESQGKNRHCLICKKIWASNPEVRLRKNEKERLKRAVTSSRTSAIGIAMRPAAEVKSEQPD